MGQGAAATSNGAETTLAAWRAEILAGLTASPKRLSPKYLYDEQGSRLFDEICTLPEYYPTRTELALLREHAAEIAGLVGAHAEIVELGAGSSVKARLLLGCLHEPTRYLPVDISAAYLAQQAQDVAAAFPEVAVHPLVADFTAPFSLPRSVSRQRALVFFPGSTIGNLSRQRAGALLRSLAKRIGGALLLGVDICHDAEVLHAAYNDARGVTAAFNMNLLTRLNRELGADFDLDCFEHDAVYEDVRARIEMRIVSMRAQTVTVGGIPIPFRKGEHIVSEHSHKYSLDRLASIARSSGWRLERCWADREARFGVFFFRTS
jgi:L-histidine Nalpha-methyltransferase